MRPQRILLGVVIALVGFASLAAAQKGHGGGGAAGDYGPLGVPSAGTDTAGNRFEGYHHGVLTKVDKGAIVLTKTQAGPDQTFKLNKKTKFIRDGKGSSLNSLKIGDDVWVDADENKKTGDLIARKVITGVFLMPSY